MFNLPCLSACVDRTNHELAPHDESSPERQRERYYAKDKVHGRYEKQQHEAAHEPEPGEEWRH